MIERRDLISTGLAASALAAHPFEASAISSRPFRLPPEEAAHDGCFMQFPVSRQVHGEFLKNVQDAIVDIANAISAFEPVYMALSADHHDRIRPKFSDKVELWDIPTEDLWARDSGPVFAFDGTQPVVSGFNFNGWGKKQIHKHDGLVASRVANILGLPYVPAPVIGEAGGIEWDGHDTLLAHESSWINPNRNQSSQTEITKALLSFYGAKHMIWAKGLKDEDITDYHIDSLARFVAPNEVILQLPYDDGSWDIWVSAAEKTYDVLRDAGLTIHLISEPQKPRVASHDFVASYVNYYLPNGALIAAEFGDKDTDGEAAERFTKLYPERDIVFLNVDPIGEVGGGIHCATQQIPKGIL